MRRTLHVSVTQDELLRMKGPAWFMSILERHIKNQLGEGYECSYDLALRPEYKYHAEKTFVLTKKEDEMLKMKILDFVTLLPGNKRIGNAIFFNFW